MAACAVAGLSAQPPCFWSVSTLAGTGSSTPFANGAVSSATFNYPGGVAVDASGVIYVGDVYNYRVRRVAGGVVGTLAGSGTTSFADGTGVAAGLSRAQGLAISPITGDIFCADSDNNRIRRITPAGVTTTFAGAAAGAWADGTGAAARFYYPSGLTIDSAGTIFVADTYNHRIRRITPLGAVTTLAGTGTASYLNGMGTSTATFNLPDGVAVDASGNVYVGDTDNACVRRVAPNGNVTTLAGSGTPGWADGLGTAAAFDRPEHLALTASGNILLVEKGHRLRMVTPLGAVTTLAGNATPGFQSGFGTAAQFSYPFGVAIDSNGSVIVGDYNNMRLRRASCLPCPATFFCSSGAPVLCPAGSACPLSSISPMPCPKGSFSSAGAASCSQCPAGTFAAATGSAACQQCPGGHHCPPGTPSWAGFNCGRGRYCPEGSAAPLPCPTQPPPSGGWGALQVQGPAFLVDTAICPAHCFWNFSSGDGLLSKC